MSNRVCELTNKAVSIQRYVYLRDNLKLLTRNTLIKVKITSEGGYLIF